MCGIVGKINFSGGVDESILHRMCAVMEHRGPDSLGVYARDGAGLGIRRLAIIDVAGGDQPIFNEDGSVVVVMNGEIYNFQALRDELLKLGHRFSSRSDAEVLVHLYEEHGDEMVHRLRGMFAFAIWDVRARRLFCARDRVGKKPLFWAQRGDTVWFASEIRALLEDPAVDRGVDHSAIATYLALQYVPHPLSAFKAIRKLPPACTLTITARGATIRRYWSLDYSAKLEGFTIDELRWARIISERFDTDHHEFVVKPDALEIMPKLARHYGEPFADSSAIPSFYLSELAGRHVTVALNGDGGDESFAGYDRYLAKNKVARLLWLPSRVRRMAPHLVRFVPEASTGRSLQARIKRAGQMLAMPNDERYATWMTTFDEPARRRLFKPEFADTLGSERPEEFLIMPWVHSTADNFLEQMLDTDVQTYLPGALLAKMDIATMAHSVEARSPLLDQELMQFAASLPADLKHSGHSGKTILKRALTSWLPTEILERKKMGFGVPLASWFRTDLRDVPRDVLLDPDSIARGYFNRAEIERLIWDHQEGGTDHSTRIWALLQLEMWHREVVEAPPSSDSLAGRVSVA